MKKIESLEEIQKIELEILNFIVDLCEENNLSYYLAGGTLLGAIRHKGFIPWDNDIDISMPRPDYHKLINIMEERISNYQLFHISTKKDYFYPFIKIVDSRTVLRESDSELKIEGLGLNIDIFPIDSFSGNITHATKQLKRIQRRSSWISILDFPMQSFGFLNKVKFILVKLVLLKKNRVKLFIDYEKELLNKYNINMPYLASTYGRRLQKELIKSDCFSDSILVQFEQRKYNAPRGYDQYLVQMYGDYMQLPPIEEQIPNHNVEVYWK